MRAVLYLALLIAVAVVMEGAARLLHRYVMHGFHWVLHEDHHRPKGRGLQMDDLWHPLFQQTLRSRMNNRGGGP
jgi:beta-carotene 3-hydroxylase